MYGELSNTRCTETNWDLHEFKQCIRNSIHDTVERLILKIVRNVRLRAYKCIEENGVFEYIYQNCYMYLFFKNGFAFFS